MWKKIFFVLSGLIIGCFIAEISLRVFLKEEGVGEQATTNETRNIYQYDPVLGWRLVPGSSARQKNSEFDVVYNINNQGFRDDKNYFLNPGRERVIVFGDSFAFGVGVENQKTFSNILEQKTGYEILNFGVSGYDPGQYFLSLQENGLKYRPDIVIYAVYLGNDIIDLSLDHLSQGDKYKPYFSLEGGKLVLKNVPVPLERVDYSQETRAKNKFLLFLLNKTYNFETVKLIKNAFRSKIYKPLIHLGLLKDVSDYEYELELLKVILTDTKELADREGVKFLVLIIPSNHLAGGYASYLENGFDEKINSILRELDVASVDLTPDLSLNWSEYYFAREGHLNKKGHELAARRLREAIANCQ